MSYKIGTIGQIIGGQWLQFTSPQQKIEKLLVDSRQLQDPAVSLFFALSGLKRDGHQFIEGLYHAGVRSFVVSTKIELHKVPEANVLMVKDVLSSLQHLCMNHRQRFTHDIIAVTGSNGKTVVKEWLYQLLNSEYHIVKSPKSYNSQIGVPLSVWQLSPEANLGIFEAGISRPGEMAKLEQILNPDFGIMTNLGSAHAEGFIDKYQKLDEKLRLFDRCRRVICCRDQELVYSALCAKGVPIFSWSMSGQEADLRTRIRLQTSSFTEIEYQLKNGSTGIVVIPFADQASIENALHCLALIKLLRPEIPELDLAFQNLLPVAMRLEALEGINGCIVINDVYNADLESLAVALSFANFQSNQINKTIILSDLLQQANDSLLYPKVAALLKQHEFKRLFAVGSEIRKILPHLDAIEAHFFEDTESLIVGLQKTRFYQELILVKGARPFGLERVSELLSLKRHQTILEINLAALARNLKVIESHLNSPHVKIMAMVKAAAYGSGGVEIARFLASRHVDYLTVAYIDEGIELRKAGIKTPIMVLNADMNDLSLLLEFNLEPEIFSLPQLSDVLRIAGNEDRPVFIHLKVETGMNRLGLEESDLESVIKLLSQSRRVRVKSIFSHLAASESESERVFTQNQIDVFRNLATRISSVLPEKPLWHIANSNAIVRYKDSQFDMVRIGIGMYGIGMPKELALEPVHTLKTFVSQVKHLRPGDTVGYGRREKVQKPLDIATIGIGYADGLIRKAGNRRYAVVLDGRRAPIVGSVCMDMTMIDVTGLEDVQIGTEVIVFGKEPTIDELAEAADTIPYEVFTSLSARVKRIYTYE